MATVVYVKDILKLGEDEFVLAMVGLGLGSTVTALLLGLATGRYESGAKGPAELHGLCYRWTERALLTGGVVLSLILLPGIWRPSFLLFACLWILSGVGQALIDIATRKTHAFLLRRLARDPGNPLLAKAEGMLRFHLAGRRALEAQDWPACLAEYQAQFPTDSRAGRDQAAGPGYASPSTLRST